MKPYERTRTVMKAGFLALAALTMIVTPACKRDAVEEPGPPTGPSGKSYFITISASPSVLSSNTKATAAITAVLRRYDGAPVPGQSVRFEITDNNAATTNIGSLSTKSGITDSAGIARTVYTVPKVDVEEFVNVRATWANAPWTEEYWSWVPISLRYKGDPPFANEYPIADFEIVTPAPFEVREEITFDAKDLSSDPDGVIAKWIWDFGDKRPVVNFETLDLASPALNQPIVTHRYQEAGSYIITLKVVDNLGAYDVTQQAIVVGDLTGLVPTSVFTIVTPTPIQPEQEVTFDGSASSDADGAIRRWDWSWGDDKFSYNAGPITTHSYKEVGRYVVSLTVTDDSGLKGVSSQDLLIGGSGTAPTASFFFSPVNPAKNTQVVFDASASSDPDGAIQSYSWNFADQQSSNIGPITYHTYGNDGNYFVILTVTDDSGLQAVATGTVPVGGAGDPNAPTACFSMTPDPVSTTVLVGERIKFDGSCSGDSDDTPPGIIKVWRWQFGDGSVEHGSIQTHAYMYSSVFTVFLTVTDDEGLTDVLSTTFTIEVGVPPVADAGGDQSFTSLICPQAKVVAFSGASSDDPDGTIVSWTWDFNDGSSPVTVGTPSTTHTYTVTSDVTYTVTLTVTDNDGLTDIDTTTVLLDCFPP